MVPARSLALGLAWIAALGIAYLAAAARRAGRDARELFLEPTHP